MPNTVDDCKVPFFVLDVYYEFNKSVCCEFFPVLNRFSGLHRKIHPETGYIFSSEKYPKELLRGQLAGSDLYSSKELDKTASDSQGDTPCYSPWAKTSWDMSSKIRSLLAWVWSDVGSLENVHSPVGSLHVTADACWPVWFIFSYVTVVPELFWWIQNYYHCRKGHRVVTKWITLTKRVRVGVISTLSHLEETWMSSLMWRTAIKC